MTAIVVEDALATLDGTQRDAIKATSVNLRERAARTANGDQARAQSIYDGWYEVALPDMIETALCPNPPCPTQEMLDHAVFVAAQLAIIG